MTVASSTIFALASGRPPCAIAVIRVSGPMAMAALQQLSRRPPPRPRQLVRRDLFGDDGQMLDRAMAVVFPAPASATGEDVIELHTHGGPAVTADVLGALARLGLERAGPGAFTRRAFDNGRLDLGQVEALGDLLAAETEGQRRAALARTGGDLASVVEAWREVLLTARAEIEAALDFADEEGVAAELSPAVRTALSRLVREMARRQDDVERSSLIHNGVSVVITGPVNAGKSMLFNALARRDAAIVSPVPGTTRDIVEARVSIAGNLVILADTAGERPTADPIEQEGMRRGAVRAARADIIIDLSTEPMTDSIAVVAQCDRTGALPGWRSRRLHLSALTGAGLDLLEAEIVARLEKLLGQDEPPVVATERQRHAIASAQSAIAAALKSGDPVIIAEELRRATSALERLIGRVSPDAVLDEIFGRFCIGK